MSHLTPIIFILLAVRNTEGAVTPVVTLSPNWNNVYSGDRVTLSCSVGSVEEDKRGYDYYTWYKDGKFYMNGKSRTFTANVEDNGVYKCSGRSGIYSDPVRLHVISDEGAVTPVVTLSPNWNNVHSGDWVTLSCSVGSVEEDKRGDYYYTWYKDSKVYMTEKSRTFNAKKEHNGVYKCSVGSGVYSNPVQLNVISDAVLILQTPPDIIEGDSPSLRCHSKNKNNNKIYYYMNGKLINIGDTSQIPNITAAQTGMYKCGKYIQDRWKAAETYINVQGEFYFYILFYLNDLYYC
ncbi:low affinity immunoglobulin gamma Fc region receptor III-A-like [Lithobates pipiens]